MKKVSNNLRKTKSKRGEVPEEDWLMIHTVKWWLNQVIEDQMKHVHNNKKYSVEHNLLSCSCFALWDTFLNHCFHPPKSSFILPDEGSFWGIF